ncbi:hypothetical protein FRB94_002665 [Tulasnella sp. JGI-2019a]|nr:hypothetical protein FRB93_002107 [Tulasnella sp. JGI-2019a]KAG9004074.1 hypothetical protein FRB94_002665 [Tulasnella sp. JGI-2019a]KAG9031371.1 hypothetical protein FRB95_002802 [Tulasnella sp. JGI-2019a]
MGNLEEAEGPIDPATSPSALQLIAVRMVLTLFGTTSWMHYNKIPHPFVGPPGMRKWLLARGFFGFFGLFGAYFSVQYLSLSDVTTIGFLVPTFTAFLGCQLLGESFSRQEAVAGLASLLGVVLIARPTFLFGSSGATPYIIPEASASFANSTMASISPSVPEPPSSDYTRIIAAAFSLLSVTGLSLANIAMRHVGTRAHIMHSITYFTASCLVMSIASTTFLGIPWVLPPNPALWLLGVIAAGSLGFMGQMLATRGFQLVSAGRGSLAGYIGIVWSLILQRIFFSAKISRLSLFGSAVVVFSAAYVTVTKPTSPTELASANDQKSHSETLEVENIGLMPLLDPDNDTDDDDDDLEAQTPATPNEHKTGSYHTMHRKSMEMKEMKEHESDDDVNVVWSP